MLLLARYRPLHLERHIRHVVPPQKPPRESFYCLYLLLHVLATGLQPIGLITRRALPLDLPLFPEKVSETMDCLCVRLALCFDNDTRLMFGRSICRLMIPMSGKIMGICCVALLPASRFTMVLVVWLSVLLPSDIANNSNNFEINSAHAVPMLALCEDDLCLLLFLNFSGQFQFPMHQ